ncbi:hypothetical protein K432DRAFT_162557 [Lepidopterella palustris CBS 459.81]|uniref:Uncharacterized protein n=1 Tax=Lepidopterella palustris CBS 459.81 TaxID=1314670 RepID=A0A8E2E216_9PEZI|nr:hypothetical protein K432DRAFT_162557 [Lepidopterella palustris CBS 459.81]
MALIAGSENLLQLVRERGREGSRKGDQVLTRLGWFEDGKGEVRWSFEVVEWDWEQNRDGERGRVTWLNWPREHKEKEGEEDRRPYTPPSLTVSWKLMQTLNRLLIERSRCPHLYTMRRCNVALQELKRPSRHSILTWVVSRRTVLTIEVSQRACAEQMKNKIRMH